MDVISRRAVGTFVVMDRSIPEADLNFKSARSCDEAAELRHLRLRTDTMQLNLRKLAYGVHFGATESRQELPGFSVSLLTATLRSEDVPLHTHDNASFVFVLSGVYRSRADGVPRNICAPTLIFNPAGTTHRDSFLRPQGRFLAVSVSDEVLRTAKDGAPLSASAVGFCNPKALGPAFRLTAQCFASPGDSVFTTEALCWELLSYPAGERLWPKENGTASPAWTARAKELLNDCPSSQGITRMAKELGLHPVYFARAFRRTFRCTPAEYRMRCRLGKAIALLRNQKLALSEVCLEAGFFDQSHFTRAFRGHFGISPHAYRKHL